jgi:predicted DNA-binding transcriptional regulator AlpA
MSQQFWTAAQVAEFLGCKQSTVERWRRASEGPPAVRLNARHIRYRPEDVAAWIETRKDAGLSKLLAEQQSGMVAFQIMGIYALRLIDGDSVIFLNRHYKPIGADRRGGHVIYEDHPTRLKLPMVWEKLAALLDYQLRPDMTDTIWLYDGATDPFNRCYKVHGPSWHTYCRKLQKLMRLAWRPYNSEYRSDFNLQMNHDSAEYALPPNLAGAE